MFSESEVADMFTTIVVGVDGLQGGRDALALAQRMGHLAGGGLVAVHVHPYEPFPLRGLRTDIEALAQDEAQTLLEGQLAEAGVQARAIATAETSPGRGLHRIADGLEADLIIIGSPHRGALGRVVAGDTARAVIQGASARSSSRARAPRRSPEKSWASATTARRRAAPPSPGRSASPSPSAPPSTFCAPPSPRRASRPASRTASTGSPSPPIASSTPRGSWLRPWPNSATAPPAKPSPARPATSWSRLSQQVDLLVLGSRGYGPLRRALLGGSADRIVHGAACPVVVVPRGAHEEHAAEHAAPAELTAG